MLPDIQKYGEEPIPAGDFWLREIPARHIPRLWPELRKVLLANQDLWEDAQTIDSLYTGFAGGFLQLWVIGKETGSYMYFVTTITSYPNCKVFEIVMGMGDHLFAFLEPSIEYLRHYAAKQGCDYFDIVGRPGWMRALKGLGFETREVRMRTSAKLERVH